MKEICPIEFKAKVKALHERLEPTEVICPNKDNCEKYGCVFIEEPVRLDHNIIYQAKEIEV